jgi:two-component system nitrogen regulation sensor histidine kinase GlnL
MNLWRDILDSLNDAVIALSTSLELKAINPAGETLLGVSQANSALIRELIKGNEWLLGMLRVSLLHGEDLSYAEATLKLAGREIVVRAEVSPLFDESGRSDGAVLLIHDLSHQRSAQNLNDPEEAHLGLSPAGLAHEVKNPLTGIKGAAELMAALLPNDSRAQQYSGLIMEGVSRIQSLVEQVLSVSGPQRLKKAAVNIHQVLHKSLALAGLHPNAHPGVKVEELFDPSLPEIIGDSDALERVFLNLLRNAIEAVGPSGTIRLRTRIETQFRRTPGGKHRQFLRVEVSDSGKGMPASDMNRLFTPFFTTKPQGTGLGLVLSQRIIALHGGKLWAEPSNREASSIRSSATHASIDEGSSLRAGSFGSDRAIREDAGDRSILSGLTFKVTLPIDSGP